MTISGKFTNTATIIKAEDLIIEIESLEIRTPLKSMLKNNNIHYLAELLINLPEELMVNGIAEGSINNMNGQLRPMGYKIGMLRMPPYTPLSDLVNDTREQLAETKNALNKRTIIKRFYEDLSKGMQGLEMIKGGIVVFACPLPSVFIRAADVTNLSTVEMQRIAVKAIRNELAARLSKE